MAKLHADNLTYVVPYWLHTLYVYNMHEILHFYKALKFCFSEYHDIWCFTLLPDHLWGERIKAKKILEVKSEGIYCHSYVFMYQNKFKELNSLYNHASNDLNGTWSQVSQHPDFCPNIH